MLFENVFYLQSCKHLEIDYLSDSDKRSIKRELKKDFIANPNMNYGGVQSFDVGTHVTFLNREEFKNDEWVENIFNDEPIDPFPVARLTDSSIITSPIPIAHPLRDVVKQQEPQLFKEFETLELKIQKLEAEIDEIKMPTDREILIKHPEMKPSTLKKLDAIDKELASGKLKTRGSQTK